MCSAEAEVMVVQADVKFDEENDEIAEAKVVLVEHEVEMGGARRRAGGAQGNACAARGHVRAGDEWRFVFANESSKAHRCADADVFVFLIGGHDGDDGNGRFGFSLARRGGAH